MMIDLKKNHPRIIPVILLVFVLCLIGAQPAFALFGGKVNSFSADMVEVAPNGKVVNTSKLYMTPDAMRMDGMPGGGGKGMPKMDISFLVLKKKDKQYLYNHEKKLVFESPVDEEMTQAGYKAMDNIESEKVLGKEKVSGYKCEKKEVTTSMTVMGQTIKNTLIIWENDKFEMPLRTQDEEGGIQEMRNIKTGKPSKKLFRPKAGYKKVDNMMAVMGIDFGAIMAQDEVMEEEEEEAQTMSNSAAGQQNMENMDVSKLMEQVNQTMGENMSPEEKAQFMEVMSHVMNRVKDTKEGPGAANKIWQIIPRRPGDKVGSELKTTNVLNVIMGTKANLTTVFDFYKNKLSSKGWKDQGMYLKNGEGSIHMTKGDQNLSISSAENPGIKGAYTLFYMMQLQGPTVPAVAQPVSQLASVQERQLPDPTLLFANSDFEMGDLTSWTADGNAFDFQPTKGDNPTARGRKGQPSRHQGEFWIGTFEKYQGTEGERSGKRQGDRPTGTLTSVSFEIKADKISFFVSGGKRKDKEMVSLVVDGQVVLSATGNGHETLKKQVWDVTAYKGKTAQIIIKDEHSGGWGHINADDFRYTQIQ